MLIEPKNHRPAIIVPVVDRDVESALIRIDELATNNLVDIVELRIDYMKCCRDVNALGIYLKNVTKRLMRKPSILTFRTRVEGGESEIDISDYVRLYEDIITISSPTYIDVEINRGRDVVSRILENSRRKNVKVIVSAHDFYKTNSSDKLFEKMVAMRATGADVVKLAVMPKDRGDVLSLLTATWNMKMHFPDTPLITMSMGRLGSFSRVTGELFGSDATFGAVDLSSAPGQLSIVTLKKAMDMMRDLFI